jgi:uncharacterized protein YjiS (DUF1127 family)
MTNYLHRSEANTAAFLRFHDRIPQSRTKSLLAWLMRGLERANQREDLSELNDFQLADIGVTRREAEREAGKWFWE